MSVLPCMSVVQGMLAVGVAIIVLNALLIAGLIWAVLHFTLADRVKGSIKHAFMKTRLHSLHKAMRKLLSKRAGPQGDDASGSATDHDGQAGGGVSPASPACSAPPSTTQSGCASPAHGKSATGSVRGQGMPKASA